MILGVAKEDIRRRVFENKTVALFRDQKVEAVASYEVIPAEKEIDEDSVRGAIEGKGFDAVLVTKMLKVNKQTEYVPGQTYVSNYWGSPHYRGVS